MLFLFVSLATKLINLLYDIKGHSCGTPATLIVGSFVTYLSRLKDPSLDLILAAIIGPHASNLGTECRLTLFHKGHAPVLLLSESEDAGFNRCE